jgi:hypothetical protein
MKRGRVSARFITAASLLIAAGISGGGAHAAAACNNLGPVALCYHATDPGYGTWVAVGTSDGAVGVIAGPDLNGAAGGAIWMGNNNTGAVLICGASHTYELQYWENSPYQNSLDSGISC